MPVSLAVAINNSAPAIINRLPPETLARIFILSKTYCIALNTASLWTHVDVNLQTRRELLDLLYSRSKILPIHAHILDLEPREETTDEIDNARTEYPIGDMMVALGPHLHRVCTLSITSSTYRWHFVFAVLNAWSDHGNAGPLRSLEVDRNRTPGTYVLSISRRNRNIEKMLLGADTLYLCSTVFEWSSNVYSGLVDLQLDFDGDVPILPSQLANILTACPTLHTLKLAGLWVRDVANWTPPPPIVMQYLEVVNLTRMDPDDASSVLSLITLSGPRTELSITFSHASTLDNKLASFFSRSKITTLFHTFYDCNYDCDGRLNDQDCDTNTFYASKFFPRYLPHIHTLILHQSRLNSSQVDQPGILSPPSSLQSRSRNVVLLECTADLDALKRLVLEVGIQNIRLERCRISHHPLAPDLQTIRSSLRQEYPHPRCWVSDDDSTYHLACRSMFNSDYCSR